MTARNERDLLLTVSSTDKRGLESLTPQETLARSQVEILRLGLENSTNVHERRIAASNAARIWRSLPADLQDSYVRLISGIWRCYSATDQRDRANRFAERLISFGQRNGRPSIHAEGLLAKGLSFLSTGDLQKAIDVLELSKALFTSAGRNSHDVVRASILLADAYTFTMDRSSGLALLQRSRELCLRNEDVPLLASVSQTLGILTLVNGDLRASCRYFEFVMKSSELLASGKRMLRGTLGLAKASTRRGGLDEAESLAKKAHRSATQLGLTREAALAHEYLGDVALQRNEWTVAAKHFSAVNKYAVTSSNAVDIFIEIHQKLAELRIAQGEGHHSALHAKKGLKLAEAGGEAEDILALERAVLEVKWINGDGEEALEGLIAHAEKVRELGFGYEHLLTVRRIVVVADSLGKTDVSTEWWARTEVLAETCGAEPLLERWRQERTNDGYLVDGMDPESTPTAAEENYTPSRLAAELPRVDLASFGIITESARIHEQAAWIGRVAPTDVPILIHGESGTGKELFARLVHDLSKRKKEAFVAINCAALPGELLESELFGHRRGSFTGAMTDKIGLFRSAHRGTIFLDEIGEMSPAAQTKLLRVIENGEFRPVGETRIETADVRVVAATNVNLEKAVAAKAFRKDLYFRLKGLEVYLPALRERVGDIPILAQHFLVQANKGLGKTLLLPFDTRQWLMGQPWSGNVRELRLAVERATALAPESGLLHPHHFAYAETVERNSLPDELEAIEKARVKNALEASEWNVTAAAELLGMTRTTLSGRLKKLGLRRPPKQ